jgi:hypothetical protein
MQLFILLINLPEGKEVHFKFDEAPEFRTIDELHFHVDTMYPAWTSLVVTVLPDRVK